MPTTASVAEGAARRSGVRRLLLPPHAAAVGLALAAVATAAAWAPFLHRPLGSDEGGFLLLARQLGDGSSLYGDYWVDRPPLLLWLFWLAGLGPVTTTGGGLVAPGVKVVGAIAAVLSVVLAGRLARVVPTAGSGAAWGRRGSVLLVASLLASPFFGMPMVDGELLALPFVLTGLGAVIVVLREPESSRAAASAAFAGACGAAAALVKQNIVDVFVFAVVAALVAGHGRLRLRGHIVPFLAGAVGTVMTAVGVAAAHGTSPAALWDAVVVFRARAYPVIGSAEPDGPSDRLTLLGEALLRSGAAAVLVIAVVFLLADAARAHRGPQADGPDRRLSARDLRWPVLALVAWELFGVFAGGSYWYHYLTGLLPGLALLACLTPTRWWGRRLVAACLAYAVVFNAAAWVHETTSTQRSLVSDARVMAYLRDHATAADGVVVAFGHAAIVAGSGLHSPYPQLWSLPVRVNDPRLRQLQQSLAGPDAPRWVVVSGDSLASWGLDATAAQAYLERHYVEQAVLGGWHVWRRVGADG